MTSRLVRYVQNAVLRRPLSVVAKETGVSSTNVRLIAAALAKRLYEDHRFPTPEILGIDDLRIRKKLFTVATDGRTGHPVALVGVTMAYLVNTGIKPEPQKPIGSEHCRAAIAQWEATLQQRPDYQPTRPKALAPNPGRLLYQEGKTSSEEEPRRGRSDGIVCPSQWIGLYGQRRAQNQGYTSVSVPVPRSVLMQAIVEAMFVS